mmetsp:Transcript_24928/g.53767  ORF Transcript_24928/g.53767 Transcript_24928/m.53767 type:complete len:672 (-) Transcript_24928:298-2313(-)
MARFAYLFLGAAFGGVADAFRLPSLPRAHLIVTDDVQRNRVASPTSNKSVRNRKNELRLLLSKIDDDADAGFAEEIALMDADLAREVDEALSLAQDALAIEDSPDEEDIDEIANMLLMKPPVAPPPLPLPPMDEPPASVISLSLEGGAVGDTQPLPPESPPPADAISFGEILQKKTAEEIERVKNLIFGIQEELVETEASTEKEEETADVLKKEIEGNIQERQAMVKRIEQEFAAEKELLVAQMETASDELKVVMDQSAQNITESKSKGTQGEKELISRMNSFKAAIDKVTAEIIEINSDQEKIKRSKQSMLDKVIDEGKQKLARFKKSFDVDVDYAKQINADLARRADEAESKVRGVFDKINQMRTERVSLQQQIVDVETNALKEIASLESELEQDDERYAAALQMERDRLDEVIDVAYQAYAINVCEKIKNRQAIEADYKEKLRPANLQIIVAKEKQEARVKEYLDKLEEKHKKERIAIYQDKFEAISAIRKQMNAELAIEYAKIEETHKIMRPKIDAVHEQTAQVKADFEKEMAKKRQLAKEEEEDILQEIEGVRVDMTDKIKIQRRLNEEKKAAYLEDINEKISDSEVELRQAWREQAGIKKSTDEVSAKRDLVIDDVVEKQALIDSYESDRKNFRKSLRLTAKVAREKIGSKTRRLLRRNKKDAPR